MYVSRIELTNIRGVGPKGISLDFAQAIESKRDSLAGWNVIAGPNGAGKTTLLQAMAGTFLGSGLVWLLRPDEFKDWIHSSGNDAVGFAAGSANIRFDRTPADDAVGIGEKSTDQLTVGWRTGSVIFEPGFEQDTQLFVSSRFWHASSYKGSPDGWLFAGYGPHRGNRASSPDSASLFGSGPRIASVVTLFRQDSGLETGHRWLAELELQAARKRQPNDEVLRDGVLRFLGDGLLEPGVQTPMRAEADGLHVQWQGGWRPARLLGDGHYSVLALVLDLLLRVEQFKAGRLLENMLRWSPEAGATLDIDFSGVVVIDEPESHLHPGLQQRLGFWLKRHFKNMQFIVTTHSPLICQAADPGGLFAMPTCGKVEPLDDATWAQVANGTVDSAIMSRLFGLESPQSEQAAADRRRLGALNVQRNRGGLTEAEEHERARLERQMPQDPNYELDTLVQALLR
jgi:ABC-type cobalamin/Fe3+-siderophores transport system ATPase subunit